MTSDSGCPSTSSIARYSIPSGVWPKSWMVIVFGWESAEAARASCMKRLTACMSSATPPWRTFTATRRPTIAWVAVYTAPIPPCPSFPSIL